MGAKFTREAGRIYYCAGGHLMSARTKNRGGGDKRVERKDAYTPRTGYLPFVESDGSIGFAKRKVGG